MLRYAFNIILNGEDVAAMLRLTDIRTCWEQIRPGLEIEKAKCHSDWRPEDVYKLCVDGRWSLFTDDGTDGFVMMSQYTCPFTGCIRLVLEAGYYHGEVPVFEAYGAALDEMARDVGASEIEIQSCRRGFEKLGWRPMGIWYRREVSHG